MSILLVIFRSGFTLQCTSCLNSSAVNGCRDIQAHCHNSPQILQQFMVPLVWIPLGIREFVFLVTVCGYEKDRVAFFSSFYASDLTREQRRVSGLPCSYFVTFFMVWPLKTFRSSFSFLGLTRGLVDYRDSLIARGILFNNYGVSLSVEDHGGGIVLALRYLVPLMESQL